MIENSRGLGRVFQRTYRDRGIGDKNAKSKAFVPSEALEFAHRLEPFR